MAGLIINKYRIEKTDGTPIDDDAEYFVLRIDNDPYAREALREYARCIEHINPSAWRELREWADRCEQKLSAIERWRQYDSAAKNWR